MTTYLRSCDMNAIGDAQIQRFMINLQASPISHEQVVNQYLYLHFPTQCM